MSGCEFFDSNEWYELAWKQVKGWSASKAASEIEDSKISNEYCVGANQSKEPLTVQTIINTHPSLSKRLIVDSWCEAHEVPDYCPRESKADGLCELHHPSDTQTREMFSGLEKQDPDHRVFTGVSIPHLNFASKIVSGPTNQPIHFCFAKFGRLNLSKSKIHPQLDFRFCQVEDTFITTGADLSGRLLLSHGHVHGYTNLDHTNFQGGVNFRNTKFTGKVSANYFSSIRGFECVNATFSSEISIRDCEFNNGATFQDSDFNGVATFEYCTFDGGARFKRVTFDKKAIFSGTTLNRGGTFEGADFNSELEFKYSTFAEGGRLSNITVANQCTFKGTRWMRGGTFANSHFGCKAEFNDVIFDQTVNFTDTEFKSAYFKRAGFKRISRFNNTNFHDVTFKGASFSDARFINTIAEEVIDCSDTTLQAGRFTDSSSCSVYYNFSEATLGDVKLGFESSPFTHCKFSQTRFNGFQFSINEHISALRDTWELHDTSGSPFSEDCYETVENTYLKAKNGALNLGENKPASEFFRQEMKFRRKSHFKGIFSSRGVNRLRAFSRWVMNWGYNISCGYGERPLWTVSLSGVTILFFAMFFKLVGVRMPTHRDYLLVSVQSFVAFIIGDLPTSDKALLRPIASAEALLGAFAIGLFIFALTRSISRN
ncbi:MULTISPECIES: pentapeptide repeat-containing protein [Haloferax]|nr:MULTISPECIES: pentapeptide repeat-containing protein [Haloferax]